jgi:hypothetical protein
MSTVRSDAAWRVAQEWWEQILATGRGACEMRKVVPVLIASLAALVIGVGPVAADTEIGHEGLVGLHSLRDTDLEHSGVICQTETVLSGPRGYERILKRIKVRPPRMRSVGSQQRVGWRFTVQRLREWSDEGWKTTYRSPVQKATAYSTVKASFDPMDVAVAVPADAYNDTFYRVRVTMFWYGADGSVSGSAKHWVDFYGTIVDGDRSSVDGGWADGDYCTGYEAVHGDGP